MSWRIALVLFVIALCAGCGGEKPATQCTAWSCHDTATSPLAWTRAGGGERGMDILSSGDLCAKHAGRVPFVLVARFVVFFALFPALLGGWVSFRILYVLDQHGPGLPKYLGEKWARPALFATPVIVSLGWLGFFSLRALL